jgi:single-stranded-DNA-specific exonuclease
MRSIVALARTDKAWHLLPHDRDAVERLAAHLRLSPIVAQLLLNRGMAEPEVVLRFLQAPLNGLHAPELLPGVKEAAGLLFNAVKEGRPICVYGDYDADGITGTAILWGCLRLLGAEQTEYYVPNRLEEGYGLNADALRQIKAAGASVLVTVDCGIGSLEEADEARRLGLELIITDHHEFKARLPEVAALVHPRLPGHTYPFGGLSGAGVALKLAWALAMRACGSEKVTPKYREFLLDAVTLAALGTVADVVPLHDENRILVRHGLARLKQCGSVGLRALIEAAGLGEKSALRASDIGFRLAPRINAVGRLGCARLVVELLTTTVQTRAVDLARVLEQQNEDRQTLERKMLRQARELVEKEGHDEAPALVLSHPDWHPGVIGIVAGRLADQYGRPTLLIAPRQGNEEDGPPVSQGSGRSIPGFALHEALQACEEQLLSHGGHKAAAGFKILPENIDAFREKFCAVVAEKFPVGTPTPRLVLDAETPLSALTTGLLTEIDSLEPYGAENAKPVLLAGGLEIVGEPKLMGGGERHMSFRVRQGNVTLRAVAFGMAERLEELLSEDRRCCLAFTPVLNEWQGYRSVEMHVVDFQAGAKANLV